MSVKNTVAEVAGTIFGLAIMFFYVSGCIHSSKKHDDDGDILRYSPFSVYRGIEKFWHNDYAGVDWKQKLESDVYIMVQLMVANPKNTEITEFDETLEKFSEKINKYPKDKIDYLNKAAKQYSRFVFAASRDMEKVYKKVFYDKDFSDSKWAIESKPIMDSIVNTYHLSELIGAFQEMDSTVGVIRKNTMDREINEEEVKRMFHLINKLIQSDEEKHSRFYRKVFNENIEFREYSL